MISLLCQQIGAYSGKNACFVTEFHCTSQGKDALVLRDPGACRPAEYGVYEQNGASRHCGSVRTFLCERLS